MIASDFTHFEKKFYSSKGRNETFTNIFNFENNRKHTYFYYSTRKFINSLEVHLLRSNSKIKINKY